MTSGIQPRQHILTGIAWSSASQVVQAIVTAAAMLVLVRLIPPAEYGKAAVVISVLTLINAFAFDHFASQALQLPEGREPDWGIHWSFGFYLQSGLFLVANAVALTTRLTESYQSVGPLLHVASFGILLNWPTQVRLTMLRRSLDFRRLRILQVVGTLLTTAVALTLGVAGKGAYAIVLANSLVGIPFVVDLALGRWRPPSGWWRWRDWSEYRHSAAFGSTVALTGLLYASRGAVEAAVLPATVGFTGIGLMGRALALYTLTFGRITTAINETVYPVLPQSVNDVETYRRRAATFLQAVFLLTIPGAVFVGMAGPAVSRIVYGTKWIAADPLFLPAAFLGAALAIFTATTNVLLARGRMRDVVFLSAVFAAVSLPAVAAAASGQPLTTYLWLLAAGQIAGCLVAFWKAGSSLPRNWPRDHLLPVVAGTAAGAAALFALRALTGLGPPGIIVPVGAFIYFGLVITVVQTICPDFVSRSLSGAPGLSRFSRIFARLSLRRAPG